MDKLLKLLLLTALLNALSWIIIIPLWQYPDEQAHFAQVQDLAEIGFVPTTSNDTSYEIAFSEKILGTERDWQGNNKFTYHPEYRIEYSDRFTGLHEQEITDLPFSARTNLVKREATLNPPLYYLAGSLVYKLFYSQDLFTRVYAVRIISLVFFLITVFVTFKIGQLIFEKNKLLPVVLTTLVAFKPMLIFSSTGVLPDALVNLLFTSALFFSLKILVVGIKWPYLISIFSLIILGSLTRQQFLIALPIIAIPIVYQLFRKPKIAKDMVKPVLALALILFGLSYLFPQLAFLRNFALPEVGRPDLALIFTSQFLDHTGWTIRHTIAEVMPWYWGVYKWLSLTLPSVTYQIINRLIFIAIIGLLLRLVLIIKNKKIRQLDIILNFLIIASLIYYGVLLIWDYYFRLNHNFSFGIQGRYYFPLVIAHLVIIITGSQTILELILKKYSKLGLFTVIFLMIIFNDFALLYVSSSYYDVSNLNIFIKQASQYKPLIFKDDVILIFPIIAVLLQIAFLYQFMRYIIFKVR